MRHPPDADDANFQTHYSPHYLLFYHNLDHLRGFQDDQFLTMTWQLTQLSLLVTSFHCLPLIILTHHHGLWITILIHLAILTISINRGTFIVPSFDEIWPQPGKERAGKARTRMGYDYILEAMQVGHGWW